MGVSRGRGTTKLGLSLKAITRNTSRVDPGFSRVGGWYVRVSESMGSCPQTVAI